MREVFIDLSPDSHLQEVKVFGGYSGEQNETLLKIKLPERMISNDFLYYYFKFETDCNEEILSVPIPYTEITNSIIEIPLWQQLTKNGFLKVNVVASNGIITESPSRIAMTNTIVLAIKKSPNGQKVFIDPNAVELQLLQLIDERVLRDLQNLGELVVDQTYNPESTNAQSGKAVKEAIDNELGIKTVDEIVYANDFDIIDNKGINASTGSLFISSDYITAKIPINFEYNKPITVKCMIADNLGLIVTDIDENALFSVSGKDVINYGGVSNWDKLQEITFDNPENSAYIMVCLCKSTVDYTQPSDFYVKGSIDVCTSDSLVSCMRQTFNTSQKDRARNNINAISPEEVKALLANHKPNFNYADYGLPILYLDGDISLMNKDNAVLLNYIYGDRNGACTVKWQGSSSLSYEKKNYTVKFDNAFEVVEGWGEQKKYCLKANFIDHSHARNVVSAKLWGKIVKSRAYTDNTFDINRVTGMILPVNKKDVSEKIIISNDGIITNNASMYNNGGVVFTGNIFEKGKYTISFDFYNPNTIETDPSNTVYIIMGNNGGDKSIKHVFNQYNEWITYSVEIETDRDAWMLGLVSQNPTSGYQFKNIAVVKDDESINSPELARLYDLPNGGAVDGFPCIIVLNGEFHGLYTFNIPKDGWMFGMGNGEQEAIICADQHVSATNFKAEAKVDGTDFELEYVTDENNADWVKTSLNRLINAVRNSDGTDLDTTVAQYLDWTSAIDYHIFVALLKGGDMTDKNYLLTTYDGIKWFFSAYDIDSTYGLNWDGKSFTAATKEVKLKNYASSHKVMELIYKYKYDELKERYEYLRKTVMSEENLYLEFFNWASKLSTPILVEDVKMYPTIPNSVVNNTAQILEWYRKRVAVIDDEINSL